MQPQHRPFILEMPALDRKAYIAVHILLRDLLSRFESCYRDPLMRWDEPEPPPERARAKGKRRSRPKAKISR